MRMILNVWELSINVMWHISVLKIPILHPSKYIQLSTTCFILLNHKYFSGWYIKSEELALVHWLRLFISQPRGAEEKVWSMNGLKQQLIITCRDWHLNIPWTTVKRKISVAIIFAPIILYNCSSSLCNYVVCKITCYKVSLPLLLVKDTHSKSITVTNISGEHSCTDAACKTDCLLLRFLSAVQLYSDSTHVKLYRPVLYTTVHYYSSSMNSWMDLYLPKPSLTNKLWKNDCRTLSITCKVIFFSLMLQMPVKKL